MIRPVLAALSCVALFSTPLKAQVIFGDDTQVNHDAAMLLFYHLASDRKTLADMQERAGAMLAEIDTDGDGADESELARVGGSPLSMALETNGDGTLSRDEVMLRLAISFNRFDRDRDGILSRTENIDLAYDAKGAIRRAELGAEAVREADICGIAPIPKWEDLAVIGALSGLGLSSVSLAGRFELTYYSEIVIKQTKRPLHLVLLVKDPMVVRISDETNSLASVTAIGEQLGIVGVDDAILRTPTDPEACDLFAWHFGNERGKSVLKAIETSTKREARFVGGAMFHGRLTLPGMDRNGIQEADSAPGPSDPRAFMAFIMQGEYPLGYVALEPEAVVTTSARNGAEATPPYIPGLIQLIEEGAITPLERSADVRLAPKQRGGGVKIKGMIIQGGGNDMRSGWRMEEDGFVYSRNADKRWRGVERVGFAVHRQITLPKGVGELFFFVLDEGVPMPFGQTDRVTIRNHNQPAPVSLSDTIRALKDYRKP